MPALERWRFSFHTGPDHLNALFDGTIEKSRSSNFHCVHDALALSGVARAESGNLPVLFDKQERLPGADLSSIPRVRFLMSVDFPPFNFTDQDGRLVGSMSISPARSAPS